MTGRPPITMERALTGGMFVPAGPDQCWPWTGKLTDAGYGKAGRLLAFEHKAERAYADALGCEWMSAHGGRQAIPPAYTQHIGEQMLAASVERAA